MLLFELTTYLNDISCHPPISSLHKYSLVVLLFCPFLEALILLFLVKPLNKISVLFCYSSDSFVRNPGQRVLALLRRTQEWQICFKRKRKEKERQKGDREGAGRG